MSDLNDVLSGVPQCTVLAAILFIIMTSDIDENVNRILVRSFAEATRVSLKIMSEEDKILLQKYLDTISGWVMENLMEFR